VGGILFVVATPIGNLEDMTYRAVRVLGEVDLIACEDTRHTRKLLDHYGIAKPLVSYHEHNEAERTKELVENLKGGKRIALVSDAGTPLVSDPGYRVVVAAAAEGIRVEPIPGPSALLAALTVAGLPTDAFYFGGFLPAKSAQRRRTLDELDALDCTLAFYEAPHRLQETLTDIAEVSPKRTVCVCRELTKLHEEVVRGTAEEVLASFRQKEVRGEITLLLGKPVQKESGDPKEIAAEVMKLIETGTPRMDAMKAIAKRYGLSKRAVYDALEES
jgi:16S rRNA (cytidine1402-2'-O)-methyltransferase